MSQSVSPESRSESQAAAFRRHRWPYYWLARVNYRYLAVLEPELRSIDLDVPRWRVLSCLDRGEPMGVSGLADLAAVKVPTMMKIVQRMAEDGLVRLAPRENDGRVTEVHLTPAGSESRERIIALANKVHDRACAGMSEAERSAMVASLRHLFETMS